MNGAEDGGSCWWLLVEFMACSRSFSSFSSSSTSMRLTVFTRPDFLLLFSSTFLSFLTVFALAFSSFRSALATALMM